MSETNLTAWAKDLSFQGFHGFSDAFPALEDAVSNKTHQGRVWTGEREVAHVEHPFGVRDNRLACMVG